MRFLITLLISFYGLSGSAKDIQKLSWLAGAWIENKSSSQITTLTISQLKNRKYLATETSLSIKPNRPAIRSFENFEIRDGDPIELEVFPQGQKSLVMRAISVTSSKVVFENKKHDFPQQWSFELLKDGTLVELARGSGQKIELKFRRSGHK